jgi:hypothetical protein
MDVHFLSLSLSLPYSLVGGFICRYQKNVEGLSEEKEREEEEGEEPE